MSTTLESATRVGAPPAPAPEPVSPAEKIPNPVLRGPVVVALHGGEVSHAPIIAAKLIAQRMGRPVHVVTVIEPVTVYGGVMDIVPATELMSPIFADAQEAAVRRNMREIFGTDEGWSMETRYGLVAREVQQAAREEDASLLIVDAAPRRGLRHAVSGIRAMQVVRGVPCPILSVSSEFVALPTKIVAAVDFSPASVRAAQAALLVAGEGASVTFVHVPFPIALKEKITDRTGAIFGGSVDESFNRLLNELRQYAPAGVTLSTRTVDGKTVPEILRVANELAADLIVAGTHGPNPVERLFVGSVAAGLLHVAACSVLVSPAPAPAEFIRLEARMGGTAVTVDRAEWKEVLDDVSRRNAGRRATIEVDDADIGAQVESTGYRLQGIDYDPRDRNVDIMLGGPGRVGAHLTRTVADPETLAIRTTPEGVDRAIAITYKGGQTLVRFEV